MNNRFQDAIREMMEKRDGAIRKIALLVEAEAKLRTPVDTGMLKRSITHEVQTDENESRARIGTNVQYAPFVELGVPSRNIPAQRFLVPAIEENIDQIREIIKRELET